jgi:hypothetical protein
MPVGLQDPFRVVFAQRQRLLLPQPARLFISGVAVFIAATVWLLKHAERHPAGG